MLMRKIGGTVLIFFFAAGSPLAQGITAKDWTDHPAVKEIRDIYAGVRRSIESKELARKERKFEDCEPYEDAVRIMHVDKNATVRNYYYESGSDDSMVRRDFTYDQKGKLRFAFIKGGAVNGTVIEHRIYFDFTGKRIWEIQKLVEGPGYTFPHDVWPDDDIIYDPVKAFNAGNACKEIVKTGASSMPGKYK